MYSPTTGANWKHCEMSVWVWVCTWAALVYVLDMVKPEPLSVPGHNEAHLQKQTVKCVLHWRFGVFFSRSHIKAIAASPSAAGALKGCRQRRRSSQEADPKSAQHNPTASDNMCQSVTRRTPLTTTTSCERAADTIREAACSFRGKLQGIRVWSLWQTYSSVLH